MSVVKIVDHPLIQHKISLMRDRNTGTKEFRDLVSEIATLLCYEATRDLPTEEVEVETPIALARTHVLAGRKLALVPILRAGLGMLDGMTRMMPSAEVGFLGMKRDEEHPTQQITYANRLPDDLSGRQCFLIDPMLATGGTLVTATHYLMDKGAKDVTAICIIAAPEGIKFVEENIREDINFRVVVCGVDEGLNGKSYIVPGLGDAGDRIFGTK